MHVSTDIAPNYLSLLCSQKHGHCQGLHLPRVLPLPHLVLHQRGAQVRPPREREASSRYRRADRRPPLLHRGHRPLSLHRQDLQQEAEAEAGAR